MKHLLRLICLALPALLLVTCADQDDTALQKEKIQFTFDLTQMSDEGGRVKSANEIPDDARLLISIKTNTDEPVLTFEEVELLQMGSGLISKPIELVPGSYKLTDFIVVDASDEVLFVTPRKGSSMAKYVKNPLDVNFTAAANAVKNVQMEVMDASASDPAALDMFHSALMLFIRYSLVYL